MTDHPFAAPSDRVAAWQASQRSDLAQAEARIDALIATLFEHSRILAEQDAEIAYLKDIVQRQMATIERQQRACVAKDATIARLRTDPARTPTEALVDRLGRLYSFE